MFKTVGFQFVGWGAAANSRKCIRMLIVETDALRQGHMQAELKPDLLRSGSAFNFLNVINRSKESQSRKFREPILLMSRLFSGRENSMSATHVAVAPKQEQQKPF